ncbi:hypothetical protein BASA60_002401, partial [Batrachochytrium salamandrivorans]
PNDLWGVTPPGDYNKIILFNQVSAICGSMEGLSVTRDQCKAESNGIYDRLMVPGPDNEILQGQYTKANEDIDKVKEDIWVNTLVCEHMTEVYTKLFAS